MIEKFITSEKEEALIFENSAFQKEHDGEELRTALFLLNSPRAGGSANTIFRNVNIEVFINVCVCCRSFG